MSTIAIDPSINETGWAYMRDDKIISGVIRTKQGASISHRLVQISRMIGELVSGRGDIDTVIIEVPEKFTYTKHISKRTGKPMNIEQILIMAQALGVIRMAFEYWEITVKVIGATKWKGRMDKEEALALCKANTRVDKAITNHNEADAICLLEWYLYHGKHMTGLEG